MKLVTILNKLKEYLKNKQFLSILCFNINIGENVVMVSNFNPQFNSIPMQAANLTNAQLLEGVDKEKIKHSVDNTYIANRVKASQTDEFEGLGAKIALGTGMWYGIAQGMDYVNRKSGGDYDKSLFGKVGGFGDRIAAKCGNNPIAIGAQGALNKVNDFWKWLGTKSRIVYSLQHHATKAEWDYAKTPGAGLHGFLAMDTKQVFEDFLKPIAGKNKFRVQKLEQYGLSQKDIDAFANSLKGKSAAEKALALQKKELELLGCKPEFIAKAEAKGMKWLEKLAYTAKVKKLGFKNSKHFAEVTKDIIEHSDDVINALNKADKNIKVSIWRNGNSILSHLFGRQIGLDELRNKYIATLGKGNKTWLGRFLPKALGWFTEGCTNRFAGGKLAVAMQAGIFADMLYHTIKAPSGEKGKTLAERFVNDFTYFMALPLGYLGMHKIGGFKYAGLDEQGVKNYQKARKIFNQKVRSGLLADKAQYKAEKKALKAMLNGDVKNPFVRILRGIGKFINIGNETILARRSNAKYNLNFLRKSGNFFRNVVGVPLRIAIPMMIVSPFLAKLTTKATHAVFGKPTKSVLDEDKEETPQEQQVQQAQAVTPQVQPPAKPASQSVINTPQTVQTPPLPPQTAAAPKLVPRPSTTPTKEPPKKQRYIPSPEVVKLANTQNDTSKFNEAMNKYDKAEKNAIDTLSMRW